MSDLSLTQQDQPTRQQLAAQGRSAPGKVTGKLKVAIELMVWRGDKRAAAAQAAGLQDRSLCVALSRPHVKGYYLHQLEVLRTSERARNIHTLAEVRDQTANQMARVNAVKALEQISDEPGSVGGALRQAGIVIIVGAAPELMSHQPHNEAKPLIEHGPVRHGT
jgi:hypothetical protein